MTGRWISSLHTWQFEWAVVLETDFSFLICVRWHYCLQKGRFQNKEVEDFPQGPDKGKKMSGEVCVYSCIFTLSHHW